MSLGGATDMGATAVATVHGGTSVAKVWGDCGIRTSDAKVVRTFERARGKASDDRSLAPGTSNLVCGTAKMGYRHILKGHRSDWEHDASLVGSNWRDHADWSIEVTLADPQVVTYRSDNDSYCYSHAIELWDKRNRRHLGDRIIIVSVSGSNTNIITAYPNSKHCEPE